MKLDHSAPVLGFDGVPLTQRDAPDAEPRAVTMRDLCILALNHVDADERMGAEKKAQCFATSMKFYLDPNKVDLSVTERALIKDRAGVPLSPLTYGRLCEWLEAEAGEPGER